MSNGDEELRELLLLLITAMDVDQRHSFCTEILDKIDSNNLKIMADVAKRIYKNPKKTPYDPITSKKPVAFVEVYDFITSERSEAFENFVSVFKQSDLETLNTKEQLNHLIKSLNKSI